MNKNVGFWGEVLENTNLKNNDVFENTMLGEVFENTFHESESRVDLEVCSSKKLL